MKKHTLNIEDNKFKVLLYFIKTFDYANIQDFTIRWKALLALRKNRKIILEHKLKIIIFCNKLFFIDSSNEE